MHNTMPILFISHGPPTILLMNTPVTQFLAGLGSQLPEPKAILCISAHYETLKPSLTSASVPGLIYDFGGPPPLFDEVWPANGSPEMAEEAIRLLQEKGFKPESAKRRGLDHGAWVPLKLMYPDAEIPVVQLSLQTGNTAQHHYDLGEALRPLRDQGVLILGSGGAVHNLYEIKGHKPNAPPKAYTRAFDSWLSHVVSTGEAETLINYRDAAPDADKSHPYPGEHFLPLVACLGAAEGKPGKQIHHEFMYGTLSLAAYQWG